MAERSDGSVMCERPCAKAGFTLVELAVLVAMLGLFALLTVPLFGSVGTSKLGTSARRLSGTIKYMFNESALTGLEHRLVYNLDRGTYRGKRVETDGEIVELPDYGNEVSLLGDVRFRDVQLAGRGTFTSGEVTVKIYPAGWIEETGVHLEDGAGNEMSLLVMPLTGTSEISEGYKAL
jgi:general secretion pathway protein H